MADYGITITIYDPWANPAEVKQEYNLEISTTLPSQKFDSVVLVVAHATLLNLDMSPLRKEIDVLYNGKGILMGNVDGKL